MTGSVIHRFDVVVDLCDVEGDGEGFGRSGDSRERILVWWEIRCSPPGQSQFRSLNLEPSQPE